MQWAGESPPALKHCFYAEKSSYQFSSFVYQYKCNFMHFIEIFLGLGYQVSVYVYILVIGCADMMDRNNGRVVFTLNALHHGSG